MACKQQLIIARQSPRPACRGDFIIRLKTIFHLGRAPDPTVSLEASLAISKPSKILLNPDINSRQGNGSQYPAHDFQKMPVEPDEGHHSARNFLICPRAVATFRLLPGPPGAFGSGQARFPGWPALSFVRQIKSSRASLHG